MMEPNMRTCLLFAAAGVMLAILAIIAYTLLHPSSAPQAMASPAFCGTAGHPVYSMVDTKCFGQRVLSY